MQCRTVHLALMCIYLAMITSSFSLPILIYFESRNMSSGVLVLSASFFFVGVLASSLDVGLPSVQTACGPVRGAFDQASGAVAFLGIPYAQPPVGQRRWQPPAPLDVKETSPDFAWLLGCCFFCVFYHHFQCLLSHWLGNTLSLAHTKVF